MIRDAIAHTGELQRIIDLPRRTWSSEDVAAVAAELTAILRKPGGTMALKPVQAIGLLEAGTERGLFGSIGVGEGKTLLTLLLPAVLELRRPLLLLPGGLVEKTQHERVNDYGPHWRIPPELRVFSYDVLGRVDAAEELESYRPDGIICDEVHRLKNKHAAVTRRVARYMHAYPETVFCGVSGTVMTNSLMDFAHILLWALKLRAPIPTDPSEIDAWAQALDEDVEAVGRVATGALQAFVGPSDAPGEAPHVQARIGFQRRMTDTPGVVATIGAGEHVDCSIYLRGVVHKLTQVTEENFRILRGDGQDRDKYPGWVTPDGWELTSGVDVWRHANELAIGCHYVWDPRPPDDWMAARSAWGTYWRGIVSRGRTYDSEKHVKDAIDAGELEDGGLLTSWRQVEPSFEINVKAVWHDDTALETAAKWMRKCGKLGGIVWTTHGFFAERLAKHTGAPYFGAAGYTTDGMYIQNAEPGSAVIASVDANREGRNLQMLWSRNLIVCPDFGASWWEQLLARTHRPGQRADEVTFDVLLGCREHYTTMVDAIAWAKAISQMTGKRQKLLLADITLPSETEINAMRAPQWWGKR